MKNANKKKWSEMSKKERFWKVFGLVVRLLALFAVLALTISLWVSARRSFSPMTASALTSDVDSPSLRSAVDVGSDSGLGELFVCGNSGYFSIENPFKNTSYNGSPTVADNLLSFETAFKGSTYSTPGGFYPLGIYFYTDYNFNGDVYYTWTYLIGFNYGSNGIIRYLYITSGQQFVDSPPTSFIFTISSSWTSSTRSDFVSFLDAVHFANTDSDSLYVYIPLYVTSSVQNYTVTSFCDSVLGGISPEYSSSSSSDSSYQLGYTAGYNAASSGGVSYQRGYDAGFEAGLSSSSNSSYNSGYSEGQSAGYDSGYSDGLSAGQRADKNVNLDWVISSVGGLFDIKMGTGANALTFGDIVFTMVSISIFGAVLKLFFGG